MVQEMKKGVRALAELEVDQKKNFPDVIMMLIDHLIERLRFRFDPISHCYRVVQIWISSLYH